MSTLLAIAFLFFSISYSLIALTGPVSARHTNQTEKKVRLAKNLIIKSTDLQEFLPNLLIFSVRREKLPLIALSAAVFSDKFSAAFSECFLGRQCGLIQHRVQTSVPK